MNKLLPLFFLSLNLSGFCVTDTARHKEFKINAFFAPERLTNITRDNFSEGRDYLNLPEGFGYWIKKNYFNYTTGIHLQFPLTKKISLGTGIAYTQQDLEANFSCTACNTDGIPPPEKLELRFVEIPLFFQYNLLNKKIKLFIQAGAQGSYLIKIPDLWVNTVTYNRQTFKGILGIGTSIDLGKHFAVQLTPTYRYAFNSVYKETELRMHSIGISGGISYRIGM